MRTTVASFLIFASTALSLPQPIPQNIPTDLGSWDISTTFASVASGAYWRNITAIYTNPTEGIWTKADCKQQGGPGNDPVDFCDNPDFHWTLEGDANIAVSQKMVFKDGYEGLLTGSGVLDVTCATQRSCWGRGTVNAEMGI